MRYLTIILFVLCWEQSLSQTDYDKTLLLRLDAIKKLDYYDNMVVINIDSVDYHDLSFPYWKPSDTYYQDDVARYNYCQYIAITDSTTGHRPDTSRTDWAVRRGPHPYLFLRDTAKLEDLKKLMQEKHPYIRTYAFGALSFRGYDKLFSLIVDNLVDATQMLEYSGDAGFSAYPADLMIEYEAYRLSDIEKKRLEQLITKKYKYLTRGLEAVRRK